MNAGVENAVCLRSFDAEFPAGSFYAVIGHTGSGKSTLSHLVPRLLQPQSGSIYLHGGGQRYALPDIDLADLRQRVHVVDQEPFVFSATIAENLRVARPGATDEECWEALASADLAEFIRSQPDQLATIVGERGTTLSGGQKQRLCLARGLLAQASCYILDDATSAVDAATEGRILQSLRAASQGATIIMMASRLATVRRAEKVLVLHEGRIAASGTHDELAQSSALYRDLLCLDEEDEVPHG